MPVIEDKIEYPADKLAKTLQEMRFTNDQKKKEAMKMWQEKEKQRQLVEVLSKQNDGLNDIVQRVIQTSNSNIDRMRELENSLKKDIDSQNKTFEMTMPGYFIDIKALQKLIEDTRKEYQLFLERSQSLTIKDVRQIVNQFEISFSKSLANKIIAFEEDYEHILGKSDVVNKAEAEAIVKNLFNKLKIDYKALLNKPNVFNKEEINQLLAEYSQKISRIIQIDLKISKTEIDVLKKENKELRKIENSILKKIEALERESKKLEGKVSNASFATGYSTDSGYDYATVRMNKITFITSNYPASSVDFGIMCNATDGAITVTLPPALKTGQVLMIKKTDSSSNAVTISRGGSDTIEGATSIILSAQYESRWLVSGGNSMWYAVSAIGAAGIGTETPVGDKDGVNVTYTVSHIPAFLNLNGQIFYEGSGYSRSGLTLTMDLAPISGDLFKSHY